MRDRIDSMRSYFAAAGHEVSAESFARAILAANQRSVSRLSAELGFAPATARALLDVELPEVSTVAPLARAVRAYVNAGEWKWRCECGGVEYADLVLRVGMCCGCWNAADGHAWRPIIVPRARAKIEAALLARPDPLTRGWDHPQTIADLARESAERVGVAR